MPSRNVIKSYVTDAYYHVYNRGVAKQTIFHEDEDYAVFLNLLKRYLDAQPHKDYKGREYEHLRGKAELLAYCLMPNHFHLLVYLHDEAALTKLIRGVCTAYTGYYNKKYKRVGPLFQGRFKASHILEDSYLTHISRYIHLNPEDYKTWPFSSYQAYMGLQHLEWLQPEKVMDLFESDTAAYDVFLADHKAHREMLKELKYELAN